MADDWARFIAHFNAEEFVPGVLALEHLWWAERSDFFKGLIRLSVALNQLRLGLITSPRFLLTTAAELLAPFEPTYHGLDVVALRRYIQSCLELIPAAAETGTASVDFAQVPRLRLPGTFPADPASEL